MAMASSRPAVSGNNAPSSCAAAFDPSRRAIHASARLRLLRDDVHIAIERSGGNDGAGTGTGTGAAVPDGASCSRGASNDPAVDGDEEDDQEEMFVTSDPGLGVGTAREWGGPRRGGALAEPTRFGDWERKGRCTDF
jgi:hypothetical protein